MQSLNTHQLFQHAVAHHQAGRLDEAEALYRQILEAEAHHADTLHLLGLSLHQRGHSTAGIPYIAKAISLDGKKALYHANLAAVYTACREGVKAEASARQAIALKPTAEAWQNLGIALHLQQKLEQAIESYRQALHLKPAYAEAHFNLGNAWRDARQLSNAVSAYRAALQHRPDYFLAANNLGSALALLGDLAAAVACFRQACQLNPQDPGAHNNLGNALRSCGQLQASEQAYQQALALQPDNAEALYCLGNIYRDQNQLNHACAAYQKALQADPAYWPAFSQDLHSRQIMCDWRDWDARTKHLLQAIVNHQSNGDIEPFIVLSLPTTLDIQQRCARQYAEKKFARLSPALATQVDAGAQGLLQAQRRGKPGVFSPPVSFPLAAREDTKSKKIRLGYLSSDFHNHATAHLMADMFECHDKQRFETFAYAYGKSDNSAMRKRLEAAFDYFIDIQTLSFQAVAQRIKSDSIDILVDLKGYTKDSRSAILAFRPAPIQAQYIGYPGTLGTTLVDYIVADSFVIPTAHMPFYDEKVASLPYTYQPNDRHKALGNIPSRAEAGLPDDSIVFCCFNQTYKIVPWLYDIWMRILQAVPNSVLWLLDCNSWARENLKQETFKRGVDAARLIFAPWKPVSEHLARFSLADLFLDTLPYNAHTTMSDALWVGVPAITCAGPTFAARVGGSILQAVGLPELVTDNLHTYQTLAIKLAQNPAELKALRAKLAAQHTTAPLFNTPLFTRALETLYQGMWSRYAQGLPPEHMQLRANG
jgi:predicted O-linked N-acetylglucosamine transferase (SPINDLY family)